MTLRLTWIEPILLNLFCPNRHKCFSSPGLDCLFRSVFLNIFVHIGNKLVNTGHNKLRFKLYLSQIKALTLN